MSTEEKLAGEALIDHVCSLALGYGAAGREDVKAEYLAAKDDLKAEHARLSAEVQELWEVLRPFAEHDVGVVSDPVFTIPDEHPLLGNGLGNDWHPTVTVGDFRRARTAYEVHLTALKPETGK